MEIGFSIITTLFLGNKQKEFLRLLL